MIGIWIESLETVVQFKFGVSVLIFPLAKDSLHSDEENNQVKMKRSISILFAAIGWFAVIAQYILMIENRVAPVIETTVRFFSFFTILTNTLVVVYFSYVAVTRKIAFLGWFDKPGSLTAITVYITIVGLVY